MNSAYLRNGVAVVHCHLAEVVIVHLEVVAMLLPVTPVSPLSPKRLALSDEELFKLVRNLQRLLLGSRRLLERLDKLNNLLAPRLHLVLKLGNSLGQKVLALDRRNELLLQQRVALPLRFLLFDNLLGNAVLVHEAELELLELKFGCAVVITRLGELGIGTVKLLTDGNELILLLLDLVCEPRRGAAGVMGRHNCANFVRLNTI